MSEVHVMDTPEVEEKKTAGEIHARIFKGAFGDQFDAAVSAGKSAFYLPKNDWRLFLVVYELVEYNDIPAQGSVEWKHFLQESTRVFNSINSASIQGLHGEPHYELTWSGEVMTVGFLAHMLIRSPKRDARKLGSLVQSKLKHQELIASVVSNNAARLQPHTVLQAKSLEKITERAYSQLEFILTGLEEDSSEIFTDVLKALDEAGVVGATVRQLDAPK